MDRLYFKVNKIISEVKNYGDLAVVKYTKKFDKIIDFDKRKIKVKVKDIKIKDEDFISSIKYAINNIKKFHLEENKRIKKSWNIYYEGMFLGQKIVPVERVGIYVPGGKYGFNYISSILMSVIPAQIAKVKKIVVVTPPGNISEEFIFVCKLLGVREIYAVGGVCAIAGLAFGTDIIPKVDLIIGPGNMWVTEAKRQLYGVVGIDLLAGPSEVVVVADKNSDVNEVVYELLAQAEHDKNAKCVLISLDKLLISIVRSKIKSLDKKYLKQISFIFSKSIYETINLINTISPEHLTYLSENNVEKIIRGVINAGAIFLGKHASTVFGDYVAGPSHILPTNKTANFSSGVSVQTFMKKISLVKFVNKKLTSVIKSASIISQKEGMKFHKLAALSKIKYYSGSVNE